MQAGGRRFEPGWLHRSIPGRQWDGRSQSAEGVPSRLLDDLGWEDDPGRDEFTLTMPPADLARLLSRLNDDVLTNVSEAIAGYLETLEAEGWPVPEPVDRARHGHGVS